MRDQRQTLAMKITSNKVMRTVLFKYLRFSRETEQINRIYSYIRRYVRGEQRETARGRERGREEERESFKELAHVLIVKGLVSAKSVERGREAGSS